MKRWLISLAAVALVGCGGMNDKASDQHLVSWKDSKELVVLVQNGPTSLYIDAEGNYAGLEYDLLTKFAQSNGLKIRFVVDSSYARLLQRLQHNEAHIAVGLHADDSHPGLVFGPSYQSVSPVLVYPAAMTEAAAWQKLYNGEATIKTLPQYVPALDKLKIQHPSLTWQVVQDQDNESLIQSVSGGELDFALVDSHAADVAQNYFPQVGMTDTIGTPQQLAWALGSNDKDLQGMVQHFFGQVQADGTLRQLMDRYYGHVNRVDQMDAQAFLDKRQDVLPTFSKWFHEAEKKTGLDWRLVAALSYQESHWDPSAVSPSGVRGIMMLTTDTAQRLGVDRLNPYQSILGGARYIATLRDGLDQGVPEPDRTFMALAAYNVGLGHLLDARELARKMNKNADSWADVKSILPLLRLPKYFSQTKYGFARGGEPVVFVESLRTYYDVLARFEPPMSASQPVLSSEIEVRNPHNLPLAINSALRPAPAAPVSASAVAAKAQPLHLAMLH
ncbi:membrane-bound lytic murein transglycosylase MltF [Silvimonas soli]|uniref:membrane-bound lytic murein transglycosylase MltF n=1 Tax=Silvimonas soli TaxID=2980100 RepID=UPI0024B32CA8|nr:membrane-bound lytic murein transglycosylase MltF [Silvimonas soli]